MKVEVCFVAAEEEANNKSNTVVSIRNDVEKECDGSLVFFFSSSQKRNCT